MANPVDFNTLSASQKFGMFVGEFTSIVGTITGSFTTYTAGRIEDIAATNATLNTLVTKIKENSNGIAQAFFTIGCLYNFYTSPYLFLIGIGIGGLSSASTFPFNIESLRKGELLGRTHENGYASQKALFGLASLNFYLGKTLLDDMAISLFSGLLTGNSFYHMFKDSVAGKGIKATGEFLSDSSVKVLQFLPFYPQPQTN